MNLPFLCPTKIIYSNDLTGICTTIISFFGFFWKYKKRLKLFEKKKNGLLTVSKVWLFIFSSALSLAAKQLSILDDTKGHIKQSTSRNDLKLIILMKGKRQLHFFQKTNNFIIFQSLLFGNYYKSFPQFLSDKLAFIYGNAFVKLVKYNFVVWLTNKILFNIQIRDRVCF